MLYIFTVGLHYQFKFLSATLKLGLYEQYFFLLVFCYAHAQNYSCSSKNPTGSTIIQILSILVYTLPILTLFICSVFLAAKYSLYSFMLFSLCTLQYLTPKIDQIRIMNNNAPKAMPLVMQIAQELSLWHKDIIDVWSFLYSGFSLLAFPV